MPNHTHRIPTQRVCTYCTHPIASAAFFVAARKAYACVPCYSTNHIPTHATNNTARKVLVA